MLLSALLATVFYRPEVDPSPFPGVGIAILTGCFILMPMTLIRRLMLSPRRDVSTLTPATPAPFERFFPNTVAPLVMKKTDQTAPSNGG
jgi:hypothetical protein